MASENQVSSSSANSSDESAIRKTAATGPFGVKWISINIHSKTKAELAQLRRKLIAELEQVREFYRRIEQSFRTNAAAESEGSPPPAAPATSDSYSVSSTSRRRSLRKANRKQNRNDGWSSGRNYGEAFRNCRSLLKRLMEHKFGWAFNAPGAVRRLGLYDYHRVTSEMMDLSTVKLRLSKDHYETPGEFADDVRLTFDNAMRYSPKQEQLQSMAKELSQVFEEWWSAIEAEFAYAPSTLPRAGTCRRRALGKLKEKDTEKRDMTREEKKSLKNNLAQLPSEKLDGVVQIIRKKASPSIRNDANEVNFDIERMDAETLWELHGYVANCKKKLGTYKRKGEPDLLAQQHDIKKRRVLELMPVGGNSMVDKEAMVAYQTPRGENGMEKPSGSTSSSSSADDDSVNSSEN